MQKKTILRFTRTHLRKHLRTQWADKGVSLKRSARIGLSVHELVRYSASRNKKNKAPYVDLWIEVLDEFISWEISLLSTLHGIRKRRKQNEFDLCVIVLLFKLISDSTAFRHLIVVGFDVSARGLLRAIAETIEILVAILDDPSLASEFIETSDLKKANHFWHKHVAKGRIRKKMRAAWLKFFDGKEEETANWFADWGHSRSEPLDATIHPSFIAATMTAVPLKVQYTDENWLGIFGDKSEGSVDTILTYCSYFFSLLMLSRDFPYSGYKNHMIHVRYNNNNDLHKHVRLGRSILASLILSLTKETNFDHVYPDYDLSIWKQD